MDNKIRIAQLFGTMLVLFVAAIQWSVLLERTWAVIWGWYKFYGYGGGGQITVGTSAQILFYLISCVTALIGLLLSRISTYDDKGLCCQKRLSRFGAYTLVTGIIFWTLILISPLVTFR